MIVDITASDSFLTVAPTVLTVSSRRHQTKQTYQQHGNGNNLLHIVSPVIYDSLFDPSQSNRMMKVRAKLGKPKGRRNFLKIISFSAPKR